MMIRMDANVRIRRNPRDRNDFWWENLTKSLNQHNVVSDIQLLIKHLFLLVFIRELLMYYKIIDTLILINRYIIFRFGSLLCLHSTLRLFNFNKVTQSAKAVNYQ